MKSSINSIFSINFDSFSNWYYSLENLFSNLRTVHILQCHPVRWENITEKWNLYILNWIVPWGVRQLCFIGGHGVWNGWFLFTNHQKCKTGWKSCTVYFWNKHINFGVNWLYNVRSLNSNIQMLRLIKNLKYLNLLLVLSLR